jgi:hypothetical protein
MDIYALCSGLMDATLDPANNVEDPVGQITQICHETEALEYRCTKSCFCATGVFKYNTVTK